MTAPDDWMKEELDSLAHAGRLRQLRTLSGVGGKIEIQGRAVLNFSSNDYLDLAGNPHVKQKAMEAIDRYGCGSTASRLMSGTTDLHEELESRLASYEGQEAALVFGSGFMANIGAISVLVGRDDAVFCDRLNHASIIDGIALSGAKLHRYRHCDCEDLEALLTQNTSRRRLVVTDSVFSMDGDIAPISDIADLCSRYGATLMVDEAHATGVFGPGIACNTTTKDATVVHMGTLSKALGSYGGFIAGSARLRNLLVNRARSFIYTTALPPASVAAALAALDLLKDNPDMGAELLRRAETFRERLNAVGFDTLGSRSQIIPILVRDNEKAVAWSQSLLENGVLAVAIRPPTVPTGTARLRLSVTLAHNESDLESAVSTLQATARRMGLQ